MLFIGGFKEKNRMKTKKTKPKTKKKKEPLEKKLDIYIALFWIFFLFMLFCIFGFINLFYTLAIYDHNIDLAYNTALLVNDINFKLNHTILNVRDLKDINNYNQVYDLTYIYRRSLFKGFEIAKRVFLLTCALFFCLFVMCTSLYEVGRIQNQLPKKKKIVTKLKKGKARR
jgi:hypothetical protein